MPEEDRPAEPVLPRDLAWIWRAWHRLTHDRQWISGGMGPSQPGRIPWSVVMRWAERHGYDEDRARLLDAGIQFLDNAFVAWWLDDEQRRADAAAKKPRRAA